MNKSVSYCKTTESLPESRPVRMALKSFNSYATGTAPDSLELLPATTYVPPSPRGRLVQDQWVRPSLRLDHHMMPSPEEVIATAQATRSRRSSSTSSSASMDSTCSSRSEKRQGRLFMPSAGGTFLDLLSENRDIEEE